MSENPRIEQLKRRVRSDPASIAFAALAEEYRRDGRFSDAIQICRVGLQRHPAYLSARVTLGRALIGAGDIEAARLELEAVLRVAPDNLSAIRAMAEIYTQLHDSDVLPDEAIAPSSDVSPDGPAPVELPAEPAAPPLTIVTFQEIAVDATPESTPHPPTPAHPHAPAIARLEHFLGGIVAARARLREPQAGVQASTE